MRFFQCRRRKNRTFPHPNLKKNAAALNPQDTALFSAREHLIQTGFTESDLIREFQQIAANLTTAENYRHVRRLTQHDLLFTVLTGMHHKVIGIAIEHIPGAAQIAVDGNRAGLVHRPEDNSDRTRRRLCAGRTFPAAF